MFIQRRARGETYPSPPGGGSAAHPANSDRRETVLDVAAADLAKAIGFQHRATYSIGIYLPPGQAARQRRHATVAPTHG
jgi:hypothetical protein